MIKRNYPVFTGDVKNLGGKDMVLSRMVNHYTALTKAKPVINNSTPFQGVKKTAHEKKKDLYRKEEFHNVREAYKKISTAKHYVDNSKPDTYNMKPKNCYKSVKEKYDEIEHLRTLKAMTKRILSIGKMHERKKNRYDPIANPTYIFRDCNEKKQKMDNDAIKLISLKELNEKLRKMNDKERNKLLLGKTVYDAVDDIDVDNWNQKCKKQQKNRPKSAAPTQKKNKNNDIYNPIHLEYNPEKYIKIHQFNRDNEPEKLMENYNKQKNLEKNKNSKIANNKINFGLLPVYNDNDANGIDNAENEFITKVRQFIIDNNVYTDDNFKVLLQELLEKNKDCKKITKAEIERIVRDIKEFLES